MTSGRREILIGLSAYGSALAVGAWNMRPAGRRRARRNARRMVDLERRLRLHVEPAAQRVLLRRRRLAGTLNAAYVGVNIGLTLGVLAELWRRRDPRYVRHRRAAVIALCGAQAVFLPFPADPPRRLDGFVDASDVAGLRLDAAPLVWVYNPVAAMPSIHTAWAVVVACALRDTCGSRPARLAAAAYPGAVAVTVVATANHLLADVAAGAMLGLAAARLAHTSAS